MKKTRAAEMLRKLRCESLENRELLSASGWGADVVAADAVATALVADNLDAADPDAPIEINGAALEDADVHFSNYSPTARTMTYSWDALEGADLGYRVQFSRDGGTTWYNLANKYAETERSAKGIYVGRTYQFRVLGISTTGALSEDYLLTSLAPYSTTISNATGVYQLDEALSVSTKGNADVEVSFQWNRLIDGEYVAIEDATGSSYAPSAASGDAGRAIKLVATGAGASTGIDYDYEFLPEAPGSASSLVGEYSDGTFALTWEAGELAYAYDVCVSTNGGEYEVVATTSETSYVVDGLVAGNDYAYKVVAKNDAGEADGVEILCSPLTATVESNPYSYGETLTTTLSGANAEATYQWFRRVDGEYFEIADATGAVYTPVAADAGHFLKVVATGVGASLGSSAEVVVRCAHPETPSGIEFGIYNPKTRSVEMSWSDVSGETSYVLRTSTDGETYKTSSTTPGQNETSTVLKMANPGAVAYYEVGARNDAGFSEGYATATYAPVGLELNREAFVVGDVLTATTTADAEATLQWYSASSKDGEWTAIADATDATLTIDASLANSWIKVVAIGTTGAFEGAVSEEFAAPRVLAAPTGLNVASYEGGKITLGWTDKSSEETGFEVEFFVEDISRWISFLTVDADATTGTRAASAGSVDYKYRVRAVNEQGYSAWATTPNAVEQLAFVVAPETFSGAGQTLTAVATTGELGACQWYRRIDGEYYVIVNATDASYTTTEEDAGHFLQVIAVGSAEAEGTTAEVVVRCAHPETPTGIEFGVYNPKTRSVEMAWSDVADETTYVIRTSTDGETYKTSSTTPGQNETTTILKMANPGAVAYYEVGARNDAGFSDGYATATYAPVGLELNREAFVVGDVLTATTTADAEATLQWYSASSKDGEWTAIADATDATLTIDASLANSWIKVVAIGTTGAFEGAVSEEFAAPKALAAPTGLNVASYENGTISLGWTDNSSDETRFEVEFFVEDISRWISFLTVDANATTGARSASAGSVDYKYRVRAVNDQGYSAWAVTPNAAIQLVATVEPETFSGADQTLTAVATTGELASCQWYRRIDGEYYEIEGATDANYTTTSEDAGRFLKVVAVGAAEAEGTTAEVVVRCALPTTPAGIEFGVYNPKTRSVEMTWSDVDDETSYVIRTSTDGETYKVSSTTPGRDETSAVLKMANPGVTAYYEVGARNDAGFSEGYAQASYTPVGLELNIEAYDFEDVIVATTTPEAQATLQWYKATRRDAAWTAISGATSASITIDEEVVGYWLKVVATGTSGVYAGAVSEEFAAPRFLEEPTYLRVASYDAASEQITLAWDDVERKEEGYEVEFYVDSISRWISFLTADENATSGTREASAASQNYRYRVRAVAHNGYSAWTYSTSVAADALIDDAFAELFSEFDGVDAEF